MRSARIAPPMMPRVTKVILVAEGLVWDSVERMAEEGVEVGEVVVEVVEREAAVTVRREAGREVVVLVIREEVRVAVGREVDTVDSAREVADVVGAVIASEVEASAEVEATTEVVRGRDVAGALDEVSTRSVSSTVEETLEAAAGRKGVSTGGREQERRGTHWSWLQH